MPLQNRVDPLGRLFADPARGMFTGNRGIVHDPDSRTLTPRRWTTRAWIVCTCEFRGRRRDVWGRNGPRGSVGWTELFFLDEVTALAAGHRPCFFCRRPAAIAFAAAFAEGNRIVAPRAPEIDGRLHAERYLSTRHPPRRLSPVDLRGLPDGTMAKAGGMLFALKGRCALPWSFAGFQTPWRLSDLPDAPITLVTPESTIAALRAGFGPVWHASAVG